MMRAGQLKELLTIKHRVTETNGFGSSTTSWSEDKQKVHASVSYKDSGFGEKNGEYVYTDIVTFTLRYTEIIKQYDRIAWNGLDYRIVGFEPHKKEGYLKIKCELITED